MRRISSACGGSVSRRISSKYSERGEEPVSTCSATYSGDSRRKPGVKYQAPAVCSWPSSRSGSNWSGLGR